MSIHYKNPPIVEALCEFQFMEDAPWDATIPGLFYERIREIYPEKKQLQKQNVKFVEGPEGIVPETHPLEFILFRDVAKTRLIQVAPHILRVHRLRPYSVWDEFKGSIDTALTNLLEVFEEKGIEKLTLQYLNRITVPAQDVKLEKYLNFRPHMGENLPAQASAIIVGCVFPFAEERDACKVQLSSATANKEGESAFLLEISYRLTEPGGVTTTTALEWIENAHLRIEEIFEGCITDELRAIFSGE